MMLQEAVLGESAWPCFYVLTFFPSFGLLIVESQQSRMVSLALCGLHSISTAC